MLGDLGARLVVLTNYLHSDETVRSALAGAAAHLLVQAGRSRDLLESLARVSGGESLMPEELLSRLSVDATRELSDTMPEAGRRVLQMIADGKKDGEIALAVATTIDQARGSLASLIERLA